MSSHTNTGIAGIQHQIIDAENKDPRLFRIVNKGSIFSFSNGQSVMAQYNGSGSLQIYNWFRAHEDWEQSATTKDMKDPA